jgi:hypothetical protein
MMKTIVACVLALTILPAVPVMAQQGPGGRGRSGTQGPKPVTPNASPEATALLAYIQSLSGRHILSGQHNYPATGDRNSRFAADYIGQTPVIWSQDFGFAAEGDKDSYLARPAIIQEAIRQHRQGAIVTLCWHAVPPRGQSPSFQPCRIPTRPHGRRSRHLLDRQFQDLLVRHGAARSLAETSVPSLRS